MFLLARPSGAEADVGALDGFGTVVLTGTDSGNVSVVPLNEIPKYHTVQTRNGGRVLQILAVSPNLGFVFSEKASNKANFTASAYKVPELEVITGLTLHDVSGGVVTGHRLIVYSPGALRVLRFSDSVRSSAQSASVERTVDIKGVISGVAGPKSRILVATKSEYLLVNASDGAKIPLFPILNDLPPLMASAGDEFVVVQGTVSTEPAMGLFVDELGEVARSGIVLQWATYPKSIAASGDYVFGALGDGSATCHYIDPVDFTVHEKDLGLPTEVSDVYRLTYPLPVFNEALYDKLGRREISKVDSRVVFLMKNGDIYLWTPEAPLIAREDEIKNNKLLEIIPDPESAQTERGTAELQYLSTFLILHLLDADAATKAIRVWQNGVRPDLDLFLYIYGDPISTPEMFPGLNELVGSLRRKSLDPSFLRYVLYATIKKERKDPSSAYTTAKQLEVRYAKLLRPGELTRFLLEKDLKARAELLQWLEREKKYDILLDYYGLSGKHGALAKVRLAMIRDPETNAAEFKEAARALVDLCESERSGGDIDLWEVAMEVAANDKVGTDIALKILKSPYFETDLQPEEILDALKERTSSGKVWREYLKHLVYDRGLFVDNLTMLVVSDIIEESDSCESIVQTSYTAFKKENWPKPRYTRFLLRWARFNNYPSKLLDLQEELWHLLNQPRSSEAVNFMQLMSTFESRLPVFRIERSMIYQRLGLHEQALELLRGTTDYRTIIFYGTAATKQLGDKTEAVLTKEDLSKLILRSLLRTDEKERNEVIHDFLGRSTDDLSLDLVLSEIGDDTPLSVLGSFVGIKIEESMKHAREAQLFHAVAKGTQALLR